jgi:adenylosuccinate lyase
MLANLESSGGLIYSQRVMLALVDAGMDRQAAYKIVQTEAMAVSKDLSGPSFRERIAATPAVRDAVSAAELDAMFDPWDQLHNIDATFRRLGLESNVEVPA